MSRNIRWALIILIVAWSVYKIYPISESIKLGLDLQGGMHVVLGVDTEKAIEAKVDTLSTQVRKELLNDNIGITYIQKEVPAKIKISLENSADRAKAIEIIKKNYPALTEVGTDNDNRILVYGLANSEIEQLKNYAVDQSIEVVRNRIDQFGVAEPLIQRQGEDHILVQLPGVTDPERAINLIGQTAQLRFHLVDDNVNPTTAEETGNLPFDDMLVYSKVLDKKTGKVLSSTPYVLKREVTLTGEYLVDAEVRISPQMNEPYVWIKFDPVGSKLFEEITGNNTGRRLAIVLDDNVYSAPNLREKIPNGEAQITGVFTLDEARDLAVVLRAGSLPAPVTILENRTVGPSLGLDSINSGFKACVIGLAAIIIFIGVYYRASGMVANVALILNLVILLGVLATLKATLTLPGIAGIVLTLGLAVDANVLIFERIREELRKGRTVLNALELGYEKAMSTIVDANLTSLIAAAVLFQFGTGPIKGFAVTLSIGIIISMFTAIFVTRTIFTEIIVRFNVKKLSI